LANLGLFICHYAAQNEWITKNVKEWVWIDEDEGNENMMAKLKKENIGVWE
jgi:cpp29